MMRTLLLATAVVIQAACSTGVADLTATTVCAVAADPAPLDGRPIAISANFRPGMHYETFLSDPSCEKLIALDMSDQHLEKTVRDELLKATFRDFPHDVHAPRGTGTFVGILRVNEGRVPRLVLQLKSVKQSSSAPSNNSFKPKPLRGSA